MNLTYKNAGVDIHAGNELINRIKPLAAKTHRLGVLGGIGGFGALFELPFERYQHPVLVSSTDGVGTKLKLAIECNKHDSIGIDLVAMCVNDILVQGAEPLFFLDYFAIGKLDIAKGEQIIQGIAQGCQEAGTALVGGETAEMPGLYQEGEYDLAGFAVGIVEKSKIINGDQVTPGDSLIALPSTGLHANGFSLVRKILSIYGYSLNKPFGSSTLGETLLTPTRIYVRSILKLLEAFPIKALAHITGGGLVDNVPRVLPPFTVAEIDLDAWQLPDIFRWLKEQGNIEQTEFLKTFNCGVGMVICLSQEKEAQAMQLLKTLGESPFRLGSIKPSTVTQPFVRFTNAFN
jgi:phosphoribosylformylglycinamidine cyclo-ligase